MKIAKLFYFGKQLFTDEKEKARIEAAIRPNGLALDQDSGLGLGTPGFSSGSATALLHDVGQVTSLSLSLSFPLFQMGIMRMTSFVKRTEIYG